jgi:TATA-box binding protein (TBP) (component of TFIID and TFIIIB)
METKINLNEFIKRDSNLGKELKKPIIKIILSNCTDSSILIKIIGVKNKNKVKFGFKIVQEKLGNIYDPISKIKLKNVLKFGKITTTNIVVTWSIPKCILINFELIKIKFGNICNYQPSKIPLMMIRFETPKLNPSKWVVIVSRNGKCMIPGLKTLNDIYIRQTKIEDLFLKIWDKDTIKDFLNNKFMNMETTLVMYSKEIEEAESDRLHFIKSENYFWFINKHGNRTKPIKYFNKAAYKKPKKGFEQRINSLQFIHKYDIPNLGVEFYLRHNRILKCQCKSLGFY